jgi:RNA polymerase sigma factor (sigma-70 family)
MSLAQNVTQLAPSCTDHELIVAVRGGSDRAFEELYGRYVARIRSYVLGMVGDHGRSEDVTQEVFIAALRRLRETERPVAFKAWIYEIARNACIDDFRRRRRAQEVSLEVPEGTVETVEHWQSSAAAPEVAIENKQRLDDLRGAFQGLSEAHHQIMVMRELEGLSYGQIGERMGMSKPVVESTLFRARRRLHSEYDELVSGRRCEQVQAMIVSEGERPLLSLGTRQRRQLARHLSHCQPCRRTARMAGVDESFFHVPGLVGKIAALLPFPWLRLRRGSRGPRGEDSIAASAGPHPLSVWRPLQALAQFADPSGPLTGLGRAATAAAATIVVAGAGGGIVAGLDSQPQHPHQPAAAAPPSTLSLAAARARHGAATRTLPGQARSAHSASAVSRAGTKTAAGSGLKRPQGTSKPGAGATTQQTKAGSTGRPAGPSGTSGVVPAAVSKLGVGVSAAAGLLGKATSGTPSLPKLPAVGVPTVQSIDDALKNIQAPLPSVPNLPIPRLQLPSVPLPDPSGILPPLGHHSG